MIDWLIDILRHIDCILTIKRWQVSEAGCMLWSTFILSSTHLHSKMLWLILLHIDTYMPVWNIYKANELKNCGRVIFCQNIQCMHPLSLLQFRFSCAWIVPLELSIDFQCLFHSNGPKNMLSFLWKVSLSVLLKRC